MKFQCIEYHKKVYPIKIMSEVFKVSTSGFHRWSKRAESSRAQEQTKLIRVIEDIHTASRGTYVLCDKKIKYYQRDRYRPRTFHNSYYL